MKQKILSTVVIILIAFSKCMAQATAENLIFREVQITDVPFLVPLMEQLGYTIDPLIMEENVQNYIQFTHQNAWVAEKSGQVIACIAVAITNNFHRPGSFLRINTMIIDETQRRLGIGKTLINLAEKFAHDHGCSQVELTSAMHRANAHEFYRSLGYSESDTKKYFIKKL